MNNVTRMVWLNDDGTEPDTPEAVRTVHHPSPKIRMFQPLTDGESIEFRRVNGETVHLRAERKNSSEQ